MAPGAEVLFHRTLLYLSPANGEFAGADSMPKQLKKWDGISDSLKSGGESEGAAK